MKFFDEDALGKGFGGLANVSKVEDLPLTLLLVLKVLNTSSAN